MNKDNAKDYLPLVQALAEGRTLQKRITEFSEDKWEDVNNAIFSDPPDYYRIKPEPKKGWYRVAALTYEIGCKSVGVADSEDREKIFEEAEYFICWLTDRIEYEIPE